MMDHTIWKAARAELDPIVLDKIKRLTDRNHHGEALIEGAKMLGLRRTIQKLELLGKLKDLESNSTHHLQEYQYQLYEEVMRFAKQQLSREDYDEFYGAY
jgi:hypothetical protein